MGSIRRTASFACALAGVAISFVACSATPPDRAPVADPVVVPSATAKADCAPGSTEDRCAPAETFACAEGPRCNGVVPAGEEAKLGDAVAAAQKAVLASQYADVRAIVDLARLQLRRDAEIADGEATNDAGRAVKNGMRAVAVDSAAAAPRLVLALARARALFGSKTVVDAETRGSALGLVDAVLRSVPAGAGPTAAAAKALEGYVALERGDRKTAKAAFESATKLDPDLGAAWMGLGDTARSNGEFDAAATAYRSAIDHLPGDAGAHRSLNAASAKQPLSLPPAPMAVLPIDAAPLAPPALPAAKCPASVTSKDPAGPLCDGVAALARAKTKSDLGVAAEAIVAGWRQIEPLCQKKDKACGDFVAPALGAASRAFHESGKLTKSVATAALVIRNADLPGQAAVAGPLHLDLGDRYQAIGVMDSAADYYAKYLQMTGTQKGPVAQRTLAIRLALGQTDPAVKLAEDLAADKASPAADRATALIATAALLRAGADSTVSGNWLGRFGAVLEEAGRKDAIAELSKAIPRKGEPSECASLLLCAVRRIAGDPRWLP